MPDSKERPVEGPMLARDDDFANPPGSFASFPVDISRNEFVRFNLVVSATVGILRFRRGQLFLFLGMGGFSLLTLAGDLLAGNPLDVTLLLTLLFLALAAGFLFFGAPAYVRRSAERLYDQNRLTGQSYYGQITIYPDRVEKQTARALVRLRFSEGTMYIETRDMMLLLSPGTPAIVLPARCLTPADVEGVRRAVLEGIPPMRQRFLERMVPLAEGPIPPPANPAAFEQDWEEGDILRVEVNYTREEFVKMATDGAVQGALKMLPFSSLAAVIAGLILAFLYHFGAGIAAFVLVSGALCGIPVLGARSKAGQTYDRMREGATRITVFLARPGVRIMSGSSRETVYLTWKSITRAVARADSVEFYAQSAFLRVPKRCIPNFDEFRTFVDRHYPAKAEENNE